LQKGVLEKKFCSVETPREKKRSDNPKRGNTDQEHRIEKDRVGQKKLNLGGAASGLQIPKRKAPLISTMVAD